MKLTPVVDTGDVDTDVFGARVTEKSFAAPAAYTLPPTRPSVEMHIEQVVLHGFAQSDRSGIARAMESELARLLGEEGIPAALEEGYALGRLPAGEIRIHEGDGAERIGVGIARRIYQGLGR